MRVRRARLSSSARFMSMSNALPLPSVRLMSTSNALLLPSVRLMSASSAVLLFSVRLMRKSSALPSSSARFMSMSSVLSRAISRAAHEQKTRADKRALRKTHRAGHPYGGVLRRNRGFLQLQSRFLECQGCYFEFGHRSFPIKFSFLPGCMPVPHIRFSQECLSIRSPNRTCQTS